MAALAPGYEAVARKLQESSMMHGDVAKSLADAINDQHRGTGQYAYYIDHDGDGAEGSVVYSAGGDIRKAPYEIGARGGKAPTSSIDFANSKNVLPVTQYMEEPEDEDHYASMDEAMHKDGLYLALPLYERFISAKSRKGASADSFAGKGRSFPILKPEDVSAALHSIGRAGAGNYSSDTIRANIKRIAKAKGFPLPDSLKDDSDKKESVPRETLGARLVESASPEALRFTEAGKMPMVKIISPGRGSSGYYTKEVLQRDGPKIFKAGTLMYVNHATEAEEAARPEGDYTKLAAVTTSPAQWLEHGPDGAALYASAKPFSSHAAEMEEKAAYTGVSIRARGYYAESKTGKANPLLKLEESKIAPDGKPGLIAELAHADSIDLVTKAGRDGKLLYESALAEGENMELAEVQRLIESAVNPLKEENRKLKEALDGQKQLADVPRIVHEALEPLALPPASKKKIFEKFIAQASMLPLKEGKLDAESIDKLVEAEAVKEANFLMELGYGDVRGMGKRLTEAELQQQVTAQKADNAKLMESLADIFVGTKLPKGHADRDSRKASRKAFIEGRAA